MTDGPPSRNGRWKDPARPDRVITPERALDVLRHLADELGGIDEDTRAIVGLRAEADATVALVDVTLHDNGILELPDRIDGLVVVTTEELAHGEDVVPVLQLVAILPDGTELGAYRIEQGDPPRFWRTDRDPDDSSEALRPRDVASNTARRALGLPSLVDGPIPVTELLARAWLLAVAGEALQRFDAPEGPRDVEVEELAEVAAEPLLGGLVTDDTATPSWEDVHAAAVAGKLELGPFSVDPAHARWLDPPGLAQVLDRTLPPVEDLLGSIRVAGDDDAMAWAVEWLMARDWYEPA